MAILLIKIYYIIVCLRGGGKLEYPGKNHQHKSQKVKCPIRDLNLEPGGAGPVVICWNTCIATRPSRPLISLVNHC